MQLPLREWLATIDQEYLGRFIAGGGAAVKFAVPHDDATRDALRIGLRRLAIDQGFAFAYVDGATTRVHMVDQIFFSVAKQVEWESLARAFLSGLLTQNGYSLPDADGDLSCRSIAASNGREELLLRSEIFRWLERAVYRDYAMTQEFRLAMISLCKGIIDPSAAPILVASVRQWLTGELRLISALKSALIFQRITRKNARHLLSSLPHWLRACGKRGLFLVVDTSRYTIATRTKDDQVYYSASAVIDGHEVLRQFVDGTDETEGCFILVLAANDFLSDPRRGINCYDALRLRISDEVRDESRPNPFASLVQLNDG